MNKFREPYGTGEHRFDSTLVIRRQYGSPCMPATGHGNSEPCYRAGQMRGAGIDKTTLRFSDSVRGACVATEDWDQPQDVAYRWNHSNEYADTTKRANLHPLVEELTIFGPAHFSNYPSALPIPEWDTHGHRTGIIRVLRMALFCVGRAPVPNACVHGKSLGLELF